MENTKKKELWRVIKFTLFSISAGVIQLGSFELMSKLLVWDYWISYPVSVLLSVIWNFTFNRRYTFQSAANVPVAMIKVLAFYAVFTPLTTIGGNYLVETHLWNEDLVFVITMLLNFVLEFLYQRFFVFNKHIDDRKAKETV
ncbi:MAG: GtrA family protein [Oscillospiraceae bacterium]|nr:GtrA family protein [Oscillospiraceae bacterium]